jgi:fructokinase
MQKATLVIGEALVDEVTESNEKQERIFGGSPANTALAFSRLGLKSYFKGRISLDKTGQSIKNYLISENVDLATAIEVNEKALVIEAKIQPDGSAEYFADLAGCADFGWTEAELTSSLPQDVEVVHLGSLAAAIQPGAQAIENWISEIKQKNLAAISFDPNIRPTLIHDADQVRARVTRIASISDVVKVSHEDLKWIDPTQPPEEIAHQWITLGAKVVVITKAENGVSLLLPSGESISLSAEKIELVDTIGAGDTFAAALLTQLLERGYLTKKGVRPDIDLAQWKEILKNCLLTSAITCSRKGANPPYRAELSW